MLFIIPNYINKLNLYSKYEMELIKKVKNIIKRIILYYPKYFDL